SLGPPWIRRKFSNNPGVPIPRLRFRIVDVTTLNNPTHGAADLRALSSVAATVTRTDNTSVPLSALTLEEPPTQGVGGGLNSSLAVGTITLAAQLKQGMVVDVVFKLGVLVYGTYSYFMIVYYV